MSRVFSEIFCECAGLSGKCAGLAVRVCAVREDVRGAGPSRAAQNGGRLEIATRYRGRDDESPRQDNREGAGRIGNHVPYQAGAGPRQLDL